MRKVIVSINVTMDGFMAAQDDGLEWHFRCWNDEMAEESARQLSNADTILLGRKTYEAMAAYWPLQCRNTSFPRKDVAFAELMNSRCKIVFSTTLTQLNWNNSALVTSDLEKEIACLKKSKGSDILVYGSGSIVRLLRRFGLIDEYRIWQHPVILGDGRALFGNDRYRDHLRLIKEKKFESGVILFFYEAINE